MVAAEDPFLNDLLGDLAGLVECRPGGQLPGRSAAPCTFGEAARWADSGCMALTGPPEESLLAPPLLTRRIAHVGDLLATCTRVLGKPVALDPFALLAERAAIAGLQRHGQVSCGGSSRILAAADGWMAVTLARPEDVDLVPAWLALGGAGDVVTSEDPWEGVTRAIPGQTATGWEDAASVLGLAASRLGSASDGAAVQAVPLGEAAARRTSVRDALVVDLSSLWAGPLCAHLLGLAGARVVKVESANRPDGARRGPHRFFDLLHAGHRSVALDFSSPEGRSTLGRLVGSADIVIEGSRPRALAQLDLGLGDVMGIGGPEIWVSITAHGRTGVRGQRVGFGDDAAVAGGLVAWDRDLPCFCADAAADPLTGLSAAVAVLAAWGSGRRWRLDVALSRVARSFAGCDAQTGLRSEDWIRASEVSGVPVAPPAARPTPGRAPAFGTDTAAVVSELERSGSR